MAATGDVSDYDQGVFSVTNPVSRSPLLRLDNPWRKVWNWCRAHPWIVIIASGVLVFSVMMFIASKIPYGVAGLVIDLLIIIFGLNMDSLREMIRQQLDSRLA